MSKPTNYEIFGIVLAGIVVRLHGSTTTRLTVLVVVSAGYVYKRTAAGTAG